MSNKRSNKFFFWRYRRVLCFTFLSFSALSFSCAFACVLTFRNARVVSHAGAVHITACVAE